MARGPLSGPLVMAQVKSKELHEHNFGRNFGFDDVKKLIGRNVK
jgi:ribonuclease HII